LTTDRKFAAFAEDGREGLGMAQVPKDGLCISSFLAITERNQPRRILVGRINPEASWDHIGAINRGRMEIASKGWMLPSTHLMMLESPMDSAKRVLREQLEVDENKARLNSQPIVFSDVREGEHQHWDIGFVFKGTLSSADLPKHPKAWVELKFVDYDDASKSQMVRSQSDVIDYALA
jgi:ADP-ribose pyrophosphatase YjhB (NUDIX family)